jgi:peptidoglycan/xylan/chitin deacetylase (PgdA/CDA1 family)
MQPGAPPPSRRSLLLRAAGLAACAVPALALASAPRFSWPGGARGAVSLTYDDGLNSQLDYAVPQLQAEDLKATFFLVQENMEARVADWERVARLGHEIGDHTENHPCSLGDYSARSFESTEIAPMERFLDSNFGRSPERVYAYPCGFIGLGQGPAHDRFGRYAEALERNFIAARTTVGPPIDPRLASAQRLHLAGFEPTYDVDSAALAFWYLREAMRQGRWAILIFHGVLPQRTREGETSAGVHQQILQFIRTQPLWCATMGEVFRYASGAPAAAVMPSPPTAAPPRR